MTFDPDGSKACVVAEGWRWRFPCLDLSAEETGVRQEELARLIRQEVTTPFDLVAGPLIRVRVVRLEPELHQVLLTAHHIVCDGWSIDVLVSDLAEIYSAAKENREPDLPEPDKFSDYVAGLQQPRADRGDPGGRGVLAEPVRGQGPGGGPAHGPAQAGPADL